MAAGKCSAAYYTDEWHGYGCSLTEGACMFLYPDSKACAEQYGEGPDAGETGGSSKKREGGRRVKQRVEESELKGERKQESRKPSPQERTWRAVYATGNKWAIENFRETHN